MIRIRKKEAGFITFFLVIVVIAAGLWFYNSFLNEKLAQQNRQYLLEISEKNADAIQILVEEEIDTIKSVVNIISNLETYSDQKALEILKLEVQRKTFKRLGIIKEGGRTITTDDIEMDLSQREYYKKALTGESNVSDRLPDKVDGSLINVFAIPLYVDSESKGVVFATIDNTKFSNLLQVDIFSGEGFAYVIKKDGRPVVYPQHKNNLTEFQDFFEEMRIGGVSEQNILQVQKDMAENKSGMIEYSRSGIARIAAYCPSGINDWYVFSVVPKTAALSTTNSILIASFILTALIVLAFLAFLSYNQHMQKKHLQVIEQIAFTDELTGASTLVKFKLDVQRILEDNPDTSYIIVKLDVTDFRLINDQFGFATGDLVIKNLAEAIRQTATHEDETFARVNADEFVILLRFYSMEKHKHLRTQLIQHFNRLMGDFDFNIKLPAGQYLITSFKDVKDDSVSIFEKVNFAHKKAKESTAEVVVDYDEEIKTGIFKEKEIESKMEAALINGEFLLYLQPKYRLSDERIGGAEALVRWKPAGSDLIYPGAFIPLFEKNGFITKLDLYMLNETCKQIKAWQDSGINLPVVSVNFSRLHLHNEHFVDELCAICDKNKIAYRLIEVEITESTMMENEQLFYNMLDRLHLKGFTVSMDDFGTGYSSLGLLRNIPIDVIKIDRSFFLSAHDNARANAVLANVLRLAHDLHIHTVAEGVEEKSHIDMLRSMNCDMVQGYYYAKPMPAKAMTALIAEEQ